MSIVVFVCSIAGVTHNSHLGSPIISCNVCDLTLDVLPGRMRVQCYRCHLFCCRQEEDGESRGLEEK